jgi:hypothetical protein
MADVGPPNPSTICTPTRRTRRGASAVRVTTHKANKNRAGCTAAPATYTYGTPYITAPPYRIKRLAVTQTVRYCLRTARWDPSPSEGDTSVPPRVRVAIRLAETRHGHRRAEPRLVVALGRTLGVRKGSPRKRPQAIAKSRYLEATLRLGLPYAHRPPGTGLSTCLFFVRWWRICLSPFDPPPGGTEAPPN